MAVRREHEHAFFARQYPLDGVGHRDVADVRGRPRPRRTVDHRGEEGIGTSGHLGCTQDPRRLRRVHSLLEVVGLARPDAFDEPADACGDGIPRALVECEVGLDGRCGAGEP